MYTELKSYQIVIALLKKYGVKHLVLSAGARNVPFVHSVEEDSYFTCYSVVDERSAGYFALGLAQQLNEPVLISCTSSTAACNYWPPVAEAYYQNVPLIILTSDRNPAMLGQREDQMIDQVGMYDRHVRKSVNLPIIKDEDDFIFCQRLVNEALIELNRRGRGPIHINVPTKWYSTSFPEYKLPNVTKIERISYENAESEWRGCAAKLSKAKRILVVCGQMSNVSDTLKRQLEVFFEKYNCALSVEYMSNVRIEGTINTFVCMDPKYVNMKTFLEYMPDIVISYGGNVMGGIKEMLRQTCGKYEHWLIADDGVVCDLFKSISMMFECSPEYFFERINRLSDKNGKNDKRYYHALKQYAESVLVPELPYSNVYAVRKVVERIPAKSLLHMSINNAIRTTNFFKIDPTIRVYANIGTYGIDGSLSSFMGQAICTKEKAYLIIGDLAFFYDMNALRIKHKKNNIRIMMLNNHGGEEFYYNGTWRNESSDLHTSARHNTEAKGWAESCGFKYLCARDKESFDKQVEMFLTDESEKPIFFEVFTEMSSDCKTMFDYYDYSRPKDASSEIKRKGKELVKATIGKETAMKLAGKFGVNLK